MLAVLSVSLSVMSDFLWPHGLELSRLLCPWVNDNTIMVIWVIKTFFYTVASVYSCHLSFIVLIFAWNVPLISLIFLKRSLVFPILLFSSISLHWSLTKAFLSLLAILWNSAFKRVYLSFSPFLLFFGLLFFSQLFVRPPQAVILLFCIFFFLGMVLIPVSCTMSRTSIHGSSGTLCSTASH